MPNWFALRAVPLRLAVLALAVQAASAGGQELPLKRPPAGEDSVLCRESGPTRTPSDEELDQAVELASEATQAVILGDLERARDLLERATGLDPTSAELAHQHGRILQTLGEHQRATDRFCRVMALAPGSENADDAAAQVEAMRRAGRPEVTAAAEVAFQEGVAAFDAGRFAAAVSAFDRAVGQAPDWPDAVYNRGVAQARLDRRRQALADLQRYLSLDPEAPDAAPVSQRIGQLQGTGPLPSPRAALAVGLLVPGMGQFYSGRPWGGVTVLSLAGGAVAAGLLIEEVTVRCLTVVPPGDDCPPGQVFDESSDRPYLMHGLAVGAAVTVLGAVEALVKARRRRPGDDAAVVSLQVGGTRLDGPAVRRHGDRVDLKLASLRF